MVRPARPPAPDPAAGRADDAVPLRDPGAPARPGRLSRTADSALFGFVQLEFGFLLGPPPGRYLVRAEPEGEPERVLVLGTLGAPERRRLRDRRGRERVEADPAPVPITRATVIRPAPFESATAAEAWLDELRRGDAEGELDDAVRVLNRALHLHRAAAADPHARDVRAEQATAARVGYGAGEQVADGRFAAAWEPPPPRPRGRRSMEAPEERFAALLGGRERPLAAEELVLRARADLEGARPREAALQARVALEALLAELGERLPAEVRGALEADRPAVAEAATAALRDQPGAAQSEALVAAVARMENALKRVRLGRA